VIDGRDIMPLLQDNSTFSPHAAAFGMQGESLACIRAGKWKLHVRSPGRLRLSSLSRDELASCVDPRGPDGVTLLAAYEQPKPTQHPGLISGDDPRAICCSIWNKIAVNNMMWPIRIPMW
jgi:hypothetical protein